MPGSQSPMKQNRQSPMRSQSDTNAYRMQNQLNSMSEHSRFSQRSSCMPDSNTSCISLRDADGVRVTATTTTTA
jgi:hypothetical protein